MKKLMLLCFSLILFNCNSEAQKKTQETKLDFNITKTDAEWRQELSEEAYQILRKKGTERPHTGKYNLHFEEGQYTCAGCNAILFTSNQKFLSDCGWPSFDNAVEGSIKYVEDRSHGMVRTEILCANCGGHLGHVFNDGPTETGKRYCVNSVSLDFNSKDE